MIFWLGLACGCSTIERVTTAVITEAGGSTVFEIDADISRVVSATARPEVRGDLRTGTTTIGSAQCSGGGVSQCAEWHACDRALAVTLPASLAVNASDDVDFDFCPQGVYVEARLWLDLLVDCNCTEQTSTFIDTSGIFDFGSPFALDVYARGNATVDALRCSSDDWAFCGRLATTIVTVVVDDAELRFDARYVVDCDESQRSSKKKKRQLFSRAVAYASFAACAFMALTLLVVFVLLRR